MTTPLGSIRMRDLASSVVGLEHDEGRLVAQAAAQIERLRPGATLADLLGDPVACVPCQIDGMPAAAVPGSDTCEDHTTLDAPTVNYLIADLERLPDDMAAPFPSAEYEEGFRRAVRHLAAVRDGLA